MTRRPILLLLILGLALAPGAYSQQNAAKAHFDLAVQCYLNKNFDDAVVELNKCLDLDKAYAPATKLLPIVAKRRQEALRQKEKEKLSKEDARLAEEYFQWALGRYLAGDLLAATEGINQTLKINADHDRAKELSDKITQRQEAESKDDVDAVSLASLIPSSKRSEKIKVAFKDEDISVAVRTLSQLLGVNIIFSDAVEGKVNADFSEATPDEVLRTILKSVGATYVVDGSTIRIVKSNSEELVTKMYRLRHTTFADDQITKLQQVLSASGKIVYEPKSHVVMITDNYEKIHDAEAMIKKIDVQRKQVLIETKIVEVSLSKTKNLGIKWQGIEWTVAGASRPMTWPFSKEDTQFKEFSPAHAPPTETSSTATGFPTTPSAFPYAASSDFRFGSIDVGSMKMTLDFIYSTSDTNILSNPKLMAIDGEESRIQVGKTIQLPKYERNATTGQMEITGYEPKDTGILLIVTPKIHDDGYITLNINPVITEQIGFVDDAVKDERLVFSTRAVKTTLRIKDGATVVIGGLISNKETKGVTKIPLLGDIPLIGYFFKNTGKTKDKTELLIFLTVNIIKDT